MINISSNKLYVFAYCNLLQDFDTRLMEYSESVLKFFLLKQRFNTSRSIDIYAVILDKQKAEIINKKWSKEIVNKELYKYINELNAVLLFKG